MREFETVIPSELRFPNLLKKRLSYRLKGCGEDRLFVIQGLPEYIDFIVAHVLIILGLFVQVVSIEFNEVVVSGFFKIFFASENCSASPLRFAIVAVEVSFCIAENRRYRIYTPSVGCAVFASRLVTSLLWGVVNSTLCLGVWLSYSGEPPPQVKGG